MTPLSEWRGSAERIGVCETDLAIAATFYRFERVSILFVSGNGQGILFVDRSYLLSPSKLLKMHRQRMALVCVWIGAMDIQRPDIKRKKIRQQWIAGAVGLVLSGVGGVVCLEAEACCANGGPCDGLDRHGEARPDAAAGSRTGNAGSTRGPDPADSCRDGSDGGAHSRAAWREGRTEHGSDGSGGSARCSRRCWTRSCS